MVVVCVLFIYLKSSSNFECYSNYEFIVTQFRKYLFWEVFHLFSLFLFLIFIFVYSCWICARSKLFWVRWKAQTCTKICKTNFTIIQLCPGRSVQMIYIFFSLNCTNQFICCFEFQRSRRKKIVFFSLLFFSFCFCVLPHCLSLNSPVFLFRFFCCFSFSKNTNAHASRAKNNNPKQKTWTHYVTISAVLVSIYTTNEGTTNTQKYNHFDFTRRCCWKKCTN